MILTLVGPPGVGKTSLGESVARAMGRSFVRVALGGVRDEAEIRGHRRTYVGALPGRIVRAIKDAGTMNPVILLDEVDKLGSDWRGDPSSALLEVLDPAQNHTFRDHYLDLDLDLSDVLFLATANMAEQIPGPLFDRMEVVRLDGYTEDEKVAIARDHLLPRQWARAGLLDGEVVVTDAALRALWPGTPGRQECGASSGNWAACCGRRRPRWRPAVCETPLTVDEPDVAEWLGRPRHHPEVAERTSVPGVATGLAVTGVGGDVLFVEASAAPGEPGLTITGQLGEVMQESAQIALSYVRAHADSLGPAARRLRSSAHPRPRSGRRHPQGRPVRRRDHDHCAGEPADRSAGAARGRHDRRDHPAGKGASDRWREAEGAGRPPGRTDRSGAARSQRTGPRRRARSGPRADDLPSGG